MEEGQVGTDPHSFREEREMNGAPSGTMGSYDWFGERCLLEVRELHLFMFSGRRISLATGTKRDGRPVRAGAGVAEEGANLVCGFGREDVFELAGLLFDF